MLKYLDASAATNPRMSVPLCLATVTKIKIANKIMLAIASRAVMIPFPLGISLVLLMSLVQGLVGKQIQNLEDDPSYVPLH